MNRVNEKTTVDVSGPQHTESVERLDLGTAFTLVDGTCWLRVCEGAICLEGKGRYTRFSWREKDYFREFPCKVAASVRIAVTL